LAEDGTVSSEQPRVLVDRLRAERVRHVYVDGGITIQGFLRAGPIDTLIVTVIPVLLGAGRPLFGPLEFMVRLAHISTTSYSFGLVQSKLPRHLALTHELPGQLSRALPPGV
jgi:riboflavin biosynthesis pyrimidine reductase